mgnify:CR=1 FL=1
MKLRNKKTGKIGTLIVDGAYKFVTNFAVEDDEGNRLGEYNSLAELNEEWEDVPEEYWYIDYDGGILCGESDNSSAEKMMISMGNYFESLEEAEKAVEKLKAFKRLKDKGFRFILDEETEMPMFIYSGANGEKCITNAKESKQCRSDIKLLFGGEE